MCVGGGEKGYQFNGWKGAKCGVTLWPPVGAEMEACRARVAAAFGPPEEVYFPPVWKQNLLAAIASKRRKS